MTTDYRKVSKLSDLPRGDSEKQDEGTPDAAVFSLRLQCEDFSVATVRELLALPRVGSFDLMPQYIKAGGEPQKKKKRKPTAICLLCSFSKDTQSLQGF